MSSHTSPGSDSGSFSQCAYAGFPHLPNSKTASLYLFSRLFHQIVLNASERVFGEIELK